MLTHLNTVSSVTVAGRLSRHVRRPASQPAHTRSSSSNATRTHPNTDFAEKRHSAATRMLRDGVPIEIVSKLLGHSSVTTTLSVYGHLTAEDARRELQKAGWFTGREVRW
ncbi:tyrosine-type recombinase/integrase [Rhodococcus opacus]|uniref:tyrosine-type recombinase/integrase n=1 Tax=Rhodococcus opacus TaxID=37919 RepID=UPI002263FB7C|nr:tyrosine-type recombinase/integrase [Rhodococcus opacus]MDX5962531.1 tyrosine-type recombinase/integrase [Rhodococcus opacus]